MHAAPILYVKRKEMFMKNMRKLMALVLAVMMVMSLAVNAYAADITISVVNSASGAPVAGHTYDVYQIFVGDVAENGKTLSNAAFGKNYQPAGKTVTEAMEELAAMSSEEAAAAYLVANSEPCMMAMAIRSPLPPATT